MKSSEKLIHIYLNFWLRIFDQFFMVFVGYRQNFHLISPDPKVFWLLFLFYSLIIGTPLAWVFFGS